MLLVGVGDRQFSCSPVLQLDSMTAQLSNGASWCELDGWSVSRDDDDEVVWDSARAR